MQSHIPRIMRAKGLTIYDLAERTGLSKQTITRARDSRIRHCSLSTLAKLAKALDVTTDFLYSDDSPEGNHE